ncbi:hypothetical protein R1X32_06725 (plasmid) [Rhodococcus opacus]
MVGEGVGDAIVAGGFVVPAAGRGVGLPAPVDDEGKLHDAALVAVPDPPSLIDLRRRVERMMPKTDPPELVLEVMSWHPGFIEAFTHVSGTDVTAIVCCYLR